MTTTEEHTVSSRLDAAEEKTPPPTAVDAPPPVEAGALVAAPEASDNEADHVPCEMKVSVGREDLLKALTLVMKAVSPHSTVPALSHVLVATRPGAIEGVPAQVVLTCSNLETEVSWQCEAEIARVGAFTIPAKPLFECVKTFSKGKRITIEVAEPRVLIQSGRRVFKLKGGMDASAFPPVSEMVVGDGVPFSLEADILRQAIKEVQFAASDDDAHPLLTHVSMHIQDETLTLAALDGYRMAVRTIDMPRTVRNRDARVFVPATSIRILAEVMPLNCPVVVMWDKEKTRATFQAGLVQVSTQLGQGKFPNHSAVIPKENATSFTVPRKNLDEIMKGTNS